MSFLENYAPIVILLWWDLMVMLILLVALAILAWQKKAAYAVMRRNFISYFSNPTGYAFLCLFVLLTGFAAFWPHEFFSNNLANLDQLNKYLPLIMLIFIPAITMSIWAEEKRQGTDELLLTLPADDFDIVIGKYVAAAFVYTVSLFFSQLSTFFVLVTMSQGSLDEGLFFSTYFGYWLMGLSMLSLGMVASFFTGNLTVGFILGALINAPFVFAGYADVIISGSFASRVAQAGLLRQFDNFGRGVISLSSVAYFVMIIIFGLMVAMVLISRRHWLGGRDGKNMIVHYVARLVAIFVAGTAATFALSNWDYLRLDMTNGQIASLSPNSEELIRNLETDSKIYIDAYVSAEVPEEYAQTRADLLALLKEFQSIGNGKIVLRLNRDIDAYSPQAINASKLYGIEPVSIRTEERGSVVEKKVILGAAFSCGTEEVVVPFFDYGIPVEYEVVRSLTTVAQQKRKKVGVVMTNADMSGGAMFVQGGPQIIPPQAIVKELEKQYEVEDCDPNNPIDPKAYDVLLVVQPSSMIQPQMDHLCDAIEAGVPVAIFEDPWPQFLPHVSGTSLPRVQRNPYAGTGPPKAKMDRLLKLLGVEFVDNARSVVWQTYNPYQKFRSANVPDQWVFIRQELGETVFNQENEVVSGMEEVLFPFPGAINFVPSQREDLKYSLMVETMAPASGLVPAVRIRNAIVAAQQNRSDPIAVLKATQGSVTPDSYVLAVHVQSADGEEEKETKDKKGEGAKAKPGNINAILVSDIDVLASQFVDARKRPTMGDVKWRFDNVVFVLNIIDSLVGDEELIAIRKRKIRHSTLRLMELMSEDAEEEAMRSRQDFNEQMEASLKAASEEVENAGARFRQQLNELQKRQERGEPVDPKQKEALEAQYAIKRALALEDFSKVKQQLETEQEEKLDEIERDLQLEIRSIQRTIKLLAVIVPPIPPAIVGLIVFAVRRMREREGVAKTRLR